MSTQSIAGYRLSPQQARLWRLGEQGGASPYRAQCLVELAGALDRGAMAAALARLAARHELLRTELRLLPGMATPLQVVGDRAAVLAEELDLTGLDPGAQRARTEALFAAELERPLEPEGPLVRWSLMELGPGRHLLLLALPALLADAAGLDNLVAELARCYAEVAGDEPPGDEPLQYVDLAEWQHELLEAEETQEGRDYWARQSPTAGERGRAAFR